MEIIVYTDKEGLHNPYHLDDPARFILAQFLVDSIKRVCEEYRISPKQIFSKMRGGPVIADARGAIMSFLYLSPDFEGNLGLSLTAIGKIFSRKHCSVLHYVSRNKELAFKYKTVEIQGVVWGICAGVAKDLRVSEYVAKAEKFSYSDLVSFARFLGSDIHDVDRWMGERHQPGGDV